MAIRMLTNTTEGAIKIGDAWYRDSHHGLVLALIEENRYDDSDFFAVVWNTKTCAPERVQYATTRFWSGAASAFVDATDEVREAWDAYRAKERAEREKAAAADLEVATKARAAVAEELERVTALKGLRVRIKGGSVLTLFWVGRSKSGETVRVGLRDEAGSVKWTSSKQVLGV